MLETTPSSEDRLDGIFRLWLAAESWYELSDYDQFIDTARSMWTDIAAERGADIEESWLYRLFDANDRLIYVGITRNLNARLSSHKSRFGTVFDHYTAEQYPDRESVLRAEARAIEEEHPAFNVRHPGL